MFSLDSFCFFPSFRNIVGLEYYVYTSLEKILSTREKCCKAVQDLDVVLSDQIVSSCYECHLKPEITSPSQVGQKKPPVKRPKCTHCKVHDSLIEYENLIFGSALQSKYVAVFFLKRSRCQVYKITKYATLSLLRNREVSKLQNMGGFLGRELNFGVLDLYLWLKRLLSDHLDRLGFQDGDSKFNLNFWTF